MNKKCPICGSERIEPGNIRSTGKIYFRPENTKFLSLKTPDIEIKANLCLECGNVNLIADAHKAGAILGKAEPY